MYDTNTICILQFSNNSSDENTICMSTYTTRVLMFIAVSNGIFHLHTYLWIKLTLFAIKHQKINVKIFFYLIGRFVLKFQSHDIFLYVWFALIENQYDQLEWQNVSYAIHMDAHIKVGDMIKLTINKRILSAKDTNWRYGQYNHQISIYLAYKLWLNKTQN